MKNSHNVKKIKIKIHPKNKSNINWILMGLFAATVLAT